MKRTDRQIRIEQLAQTDADQARDAALVQVAMRAPYSYVELKAAHQAGALVELLGQLDSYTLRAQAVRYCMESPVAISVDEVARRFCRTLEVARWGRAA